MNIFKNRENTMKVKNLENKISKKLDEDTIKACLSVFADNNITGLLKSGFNLSMEVIKIIRNNIYDRYYNTDNSKINLVKRDPNIPDNGYVVSNIKVYCTYDYDMFKKGINRGKSNELLNKLLDDKRRIANLILSMLCIGCKHSPILVAKRADGKFDIGDGQGRFEACKALGQPVYFIIQEEGFDADDITMLNVSVLPSSTRDIIDVKAKAGIEDYIILQSMLSEFTHLNLNIIGYTLFGDDITSAKVKSDSITISKELYEKRYNDLCYVNRMGSYLKSFKSNLDVPAERFMYAIAMATNFDNINIDEDRLKSKIKANLVNKGQYNNKINGRKDVSNAIELLNEIYNKKLGAKERQSNDHGGVEFIKTAYIDYIEKRKYLTPEERGLKGETNGFYTS